MLTNEDSPNANNAPISVINLHKYYEQVRAVDGISFTVRPGEIYGLLGPNGAGKSTTIKAILGMLSVEAGEINVLGTNSIKNPENVKEHIGYVSEEPLLFGSLSVQEIFNFRQLEN